MINDIEIIDIKHYHDKRGGFTEFFRKEWFRQYNHDIIQLNNSFSKRNVLRGLHYHYHQYDYWYVPYGKLRVCLLDIRRDSLTYKQSQFIDTDNSIGIFIPPGVAHGFYALEDSHLIYVVNKYYNPADDLGVNWQSVTGWVDFYTTDYNQYEGIRTPIIAERDKTAPYLQELDESKLVFSY